jgi:hypothetical protein
MFEPLKIWTFIIGILIIIGALIYISTEAGLIAGYEMYLTSMIWLFFIVILFVFFAILISALKYLLERAANKPSKYTTYKPR